MLLVWLMMMSPRATNIQPRDGHLFRNEDRVRVRRYLGIALAVHYLHLRLVHRLEPSNPIRRSHQAKSEVVTGAPLLCTAMAVHLCLPPRP